MTAEALPPEVDDRTLSLLLGTLIGARGLMRTGGTVEEIAGSVLSESLAAPSGWDPGGLSTQIGVAYLGRLADKYGMDLVARPVGEV